MSISPYKSPKKRTRNGLPRLQKHTCYLNLTELDEPGACEVCDIMTQLDAALQEDITAQLNGDYCDEWKGIEEEEGGGNVNAGAETAEMKDADDK